MFATAVLTAAVLFCGSGIRASAATPPRNVILVIGDGMGRGSYDLASMRAHGETGRLFMQSLPVSGLCRTYSADSVVTDSAASATAIACGVKTNNGMLGMMPDGAHAQSVAVYAQKLGKSVGLVTSDAIQGATPSGFYAHRPKRSDYEAITEDMTECGFEIIAGNIDSRHFITNHTGKLELNGYVLAESPAEFAAAPADAKVIGLISDKHFHQDEMSLAELAKTAVSRLENAGANGFFLMVESAYPDFGGHNNDAGLSFKGVMHADNTVKAAVDYAATRGDTLVIVTADHETGGLVVMRNPSDSKKPFYNFHTGHHTGEAVPIYAYGPGAEQFSGVIDNTEICLRIKKLWDSD